MVTDSSLIYRFGDFELDPARFELRAGGDARHLEPQVLSLLLLLASNADRMVSKDEIIEKIWGGRVVSEAAVASRVKAARQALEDDGHQQRFIRTIHGRGFRFCTPVAFDHVDQVPASLSRRDDPPRAAPVSEERPSIAVLPFQLLGDAGPFAFLADALADELIADLSRLRWLLVIARASTFRFRDRTSSCEEIGAALKVRYCLTGTLEEAKGGIVLSVELARTSDSAVVWAERFIAGPDELHDLRREMLAAIVARLESHIVQHEVELARRTPEAALDAWSAYHLGLDHMFRFNKADNLRAAGLFERALSFDPHFSRALSGLSFTAFQDCFLQYSDRREVMAERARSLAEQALQCDPLDPFAHLNLGRSLWFDDAIGESVERLGQCIALSPNYAQAIYSKAWAEMAQCEGGRSDADAALALRLSPLDPLRYAMLAVHSINALLRGDPASAVDWGEKAARSPGAHKHIAIIAALAANASGNGDRAALWIDRARQLDPDMTRANFLKSFPFVPSGERETIERGLHDVGL
ncbi:transcriptional regulator [Sphingomonas sp. DBB INV C78]|uniref:winged helix-turn-helix domain-containing protein n=1 Tax=Sphingomonas sp. DBB INV C78 TaxID=3349434 RepID=UPI0036D24E83